MKTKAFFLILIMCSISFTGYTQIFGNELLTTGNFGTTADGKNTTKNIYPGPYQQNSAIGIYYQPATKVFFNNQLTDIAINPGVTVAPPLNDNQTSYAWGCTEPWDTQYFSFPIYNSGTGTYTNSWMQIPMAPNNGNYLIATSTNGMYQPPTLEMAPTPWYLVYDKYETNQASPTNYFMIVNADQDNKKIFYKQLVPVTAGKVYRMNADLCRLNSGASSPNISFVISPYNAGDPNGENLTTVQEVFESGDVPDDKGKWHTYSFDYIAPCGADQVWIAFRNVQTATNGNDLALDNLSFKEMKPQVSVANNCPVELTVSVPGAQNPANYRYEWYLKDGSSNPVGIGSTFIPDEVGIYYAKIYYQDANVNTSSCGFNSDEITVVYLNGCYQGYIPQPQPDSYHASLGVTLEENVMINSDYNSEGTYPKYGTQPDFKLYTGENSIDPDISVISFTTYATLAIRDNEFASNTYGYVAGTPQNGTPHAAGNQAIIYDPNGTEVGVVSIAANGDLTFTTINNYDPLAPGAFTSVPLAYTVLEENGGTAWTKVDIDLVELSVTTWAYCPGFPVTVQFTSPNFDTNTATDLEIMQQHYIVNNSNSSEIIYYNAQTAQDFGFIRFGGGNQGGNLSITFISNAVGMATYSFYKKQPQAAPNPTTDDLLATFNVTISPSEAAWSLVPSDSNWNNEANWTTPGGTGYPIWCTDVVIPGTPTIFPELIVPTTNDNNACRDIIFKSGASVGKIQNLIYRAAYVEHTPAEVEWTMVSAPLKYIYSADFQSDPSWNASTAFDPIKSYMSFFDLKYLNNGQVNPDGIAGTAFGSFSLPFRDLKQSLYAGFGFGLDVIPGSSGGNGTNDVYKGTFHFPRFNPLGNAKEMETAGTSFEEVEYKYHYMDNGEWIDSYPTNPAYNPFKFTDSGEPGRGGEKSTDDAWVLFNTNPFSNQRGDYPWATSRYRFVYEDTNNNPDIDFFPDNLNDIELDIDVINAGTTDIVGNPLMSHIDFEKLIVDNSTAIRHYYRIWNGTTFYSYMLGGTRDEEIWEGFDNMSTNPLIEQASRYIAPMQAFFVEMLDGQRTIKFIPKNISVAIPDANASNVSGAPAFTAHTAKADRDSNSNILKIKLNMNNAQNMCILASLPKASDSYKPEEDVYKLFSDSKSTPEIYTVSDQTAIDINAVSQEGDTKIIPIGIKTNKTGFFNLSIEGADQFNAYTSVRLRDSETDKYYDLSKETDFTFEKKTENSIEGRFYIVLSRSATSIDNKESDINMIHVSVENGAITVNSALTKIDKIELYDAAGRVRYQNNNINTTNYQFNPGIEKGIYLLKSINGPNTEIKKIIL